MGATGGLLGALFNSLNINLTKYRMKYFMKRKLSRIWRYMIYTKYCNTDYLFTFSIAELFYIMHCRSVCICVTPMHLDKRECIVCILLSGSHEQL